MGISQKFAQKQKKIQVQKTLFLFSVHIQYTLYIHMYTYITRFTEHIETYSAILEVSFGTDLLLLVCQLCALKSSN